MHVRHLLRLLSIPRIGPLKVRALIQHFRDPAAVFDASPRELIKVRGIDQKLASAIAHDRDGETFADDQMRRAQRAGVRIISEWDDEYPGLLKRIYDPPPLLFIRGTFTGSDDAALALVGTRMPSPYGRQAAEEWSKELVGRGFTIVSGLARGIDTVAHQSALTAGGRTIAVVGSGLDVPYPPENQRLHERIAESGAVVSEFPMGTKPDAQNFPRRNRIISGCSLGTLIIESGQDGGAMITASIALDQNREVFALPGSVFEPRSIGPHRLIQSGRAKLVHSLDDILTELGCSAPQQARVAPPPPPDLTLFEQAMVESLGPEAVHIDDIAERANLSPSDALVTLLSLEFKGVVRQLPGKFFEQILR
jgi:DNA processing protein